MTYSRIAYIITAFLWIIYAYFTLTSPVTASTNKFGLSQFELAALRVSIALPYLLIWFSGIFSWSHVRQYALTISGSPESPAFHHIAKGILVLTVSFMAAALVGLVRSYNIHDMAIVTPATIIVNYLYTLSPLVGFYLIYTGAQKLYDLVPQKFPMMRQYLLGLLPIALLSIAYTSLIFTNPNRQIPSSPETAASFYLPDVLIVLTVIIPAISGWILGVLGAINMSGYKKDITGVVYKMALSKFVYGVVGIIAGSIFLQALLSLGPRLIGISLLPLLLLIYFFIGLQMIGYGVVALGAKSLEKIEKL